MTAFLTTDTTYLAFFGRNKPTDPDKKPTDKKIAYSVKTVIGGDHLLSCTASSVPDKKGNTVTYFTVTISDKFECTIRVSFIDSKIQYDNNWQVIANLSSTVLHHFYMVNFNKVTCNPELWALATLRDLFSVDYNGNIKQGFTLRHSLPKVKTLQSWAYLLEYANKCNCVPLIALAEYANEMLGDLEDPDPVINDPVPSTHKKEDITDYGTEVPRSGGNNTPVSESPNGFYDGVDLNTLSFTQLRKLAKDRNIAIVGKTNKAELIAIIEEQLTAPVA